MLYAIIPDDAIVVVQDLTTKRMVYVVVDGPGHDSLIIDLCLIVEGPTLPLQAFAAILAPSHALWLVDPLIEIVPGYIDAMLAIQLFSPSNLFALGRPPISENSNALQQPTIRKIHELQADYYRAKRLCPTD